MPRYELLAPVGDFSMLVAAINAGADAVYFGLKEFSMRTGSKNFDINELDKITELCKPKSVKRYLTLNTIVYDNELDKIEKIIKKIKKKVDAVICWDLSVIQLCRKYKIPFHISTQASVSNTESAKFYKKLGAKRIILARELNLNQIKKISKVIDVECFAHGAMCVAVSGRCFTSQFLFGKSANRGECLHPCRRSYIVKCSEPVPHSSAKFVIRDKQEGYELELNNDKVMSAKDLCTLPFIEKMKQAGIKSFKIEGRNRDPRYVDTVVRVYRKALDETLTPEKIKAGIDLLKLVYNRQFSSGFYIKMPTSDDFAKVEHSASKIVKHFIGKVTHYFDNINVATIKLVSDLKVGDSIIIIGKTTGIINSKVDYMEIKKKSIIKAGKGNEIGLKLPKVRKNDEVYALNKK